jgi:hypothetical protein
MLRSASTLIVMLALVSAVLCEDVTKIKNWGEVTDPDRDCKFEEKSGQVIIKIPGKHHDLAYAETYNKHNAPRILQPVKGDFSVTVKVGFELPKGAKSSGGPHAFASSGLLLWQDDKNYIRLERAAVAQSDAPFVWLEGFLDGKSVFRGLRRVSDADTSLNIARKEGKLKFSYDDGAKGEFQALEVADAVEIPFNLVGVAAINTTDREHVATLTGLALDQKRE